MHLIRSTAFDASVGSTGVFHDACDAILPINNKYVPDALKDQPKTYASNAKHVSPLERYQLTGLFQKLVTLKLHSKCMTKELMPA
jgi:hypothetical protein